MGSGVEGHKNGFELVGKKEERREETEKKKKGKKEKVSFWRNFKHIRKEKS